MQIPQVAAQSSTAESKPADGDQSSAKSKAGEQGAFAILLALLQETAAQAQVGTTVVEGGAEGSVQGNANAPPGNATGATESTAVQNAFLVAGEANAESAKANGSTSPAVVKSAPEPNGKTAGKTKSSRTTPPIATAAAKPAAGAKSVIVTEVVTPVAAKKPAQTSSAHFVVQKANAEGAAPGAAAKPATAAAAAPAAESGIPVAALAGDDTVEADVMPKSATPSDDGVDPAPEKTASSARFIVAKAGSKEASPAVSKADPVAKTEPAPQTVTSQSPGKPDAAPVEADSAKTVADVKTDPASVRATVERAPTGNAETAARQADGIRPAPADVTQTAPVQTGQSAHRAEQVKPGADQSAPPDRTTVKTIAIDTVKGVRYLLTKGEQTMRIRLVPESLGEMRLVVTSSSDEISVRLASASHTVRDILHTQVQHLREALSQDGANVGKITITADMSAGTGTGNPHAGSPDRAWNPNARAWTGHSSSSPKYPPNSGQQPVVVPRQAMPHSGTLNLFA